VCPTLKQVARKNEVSGRSISRTLKHLTKTSSANDLHNGVAKEGSLGTTSEAPKLEPQNSPENQPSALSRNQLAWASTPPFVTCLSYIFKFCDVSPAVLRYQTPYISVISQTLSFLRLAFVILLILCELARCLPQVSSSSSYRRSSRLTLRGPTPLLFLSRPFILCGHGRAPGPTCLWVC